MNDINTFFIIIENMRLQDLRWYDWLFIFFAILWLIPIIEILTHSGIMVIFFYVIWLAYCLYAAIFYFPIYIGYKVYKWKKGKVTGKQ